MVKAESRRDLGARMLVRPVRRWLQERRAERSWRNEGCAGPPPAHFKRAFLRACQRRHGARIFVETGTFYGDTLAALRGSFDELHSIELDDVLFKRAVYRFSGDPKIRLWQGDSGSILPLVLSGLCQPIMFWLDGHYSGEGTARAGEDSPINQELRYVGEHFMRTSHLIVIDDARLFDGTNGYPTLGDLRAAAAGIGFSDMGLEHDMIILSARSRK